MIVGALLAAALAQAQPEPPQAQEAQEIVVTATRRGGCRVILADRSLTERQLAANARIWAAEGTPVRVIRPAGAGYHCMAQIAFRLGKYGVRLIQFVERRQP